MVSLVKVQGWSTTSDSENVTFRRLLVAFSDRGFKLCVNLVCVCMSCSPHH